MIYSTQDWYFVDGERVSQEIYMLHEALRLLKSIEGVLTKRDPEVKTTGEAARLAKEEADREAKARADFIAQAELEKKVLAEATAKAKAEAASQVASEEQVKVNWAAFASSPELTSVRTKYQNYLLANKRGPTHVDLSEDVYNNLRRLEPTVVKHTKEGKIFVMGCELIQPLNPDPAYRINFR